MEQPHLFYCIKCTQPKSMVQAGILFRTGFYRINYPLGCCGYCAHQSK